MYVSARALASKGVTAVYLPPEIWVTAGRVLKMTVCWLVVFRYL